MLLAELRQVPSRSLGRPRVHAWARFTVGNGGAVTLDADFSDPGFTLGNFSTGVAALTFPTAPKGIVKLTYMPAAVANDNHAVLTAVDVPAGTATITVHDDGSAEDPASGSVIFVELIGEVRSG